MRGDIGLTRAGAGSGRERLGVVGHVDQRCVKNLLLKYFYFKKIIN